MADTSPNLHFRELDDEFMQKQAKVWLEAVLDDRFESTQLLADLLADGVILYRVSRCLKKELSMGTALLPETPLDSKSGKYLPYSHVDSFLKVCKTVGLPDVDLFTPPDVVEKKDIRRVCLCIRALSKKARANNLDVPDFDKVAHSALVMSTEKVGGIREHLQQAAAVAKTPEPLPSNKKQQQQQLDDVNIESSSDETSKVLLDKFDQAAATTPAAASKGNGGRIWLPIALGAALALATTVVLVALRPRQQSKKSEVMEVEVKEGDTLSKISRRCGKSNWKELVELNPNLVGNPDLIYPTDRLKLA